MIGFVTTFLCLLPILGYALEDPSSKFQPISVVFNSTSNTYDILNKYDTSADAYGRYYRNYQGQYWNFLDASMQSEIDSVEDHLSYSKAVGFLEGYVTCKEIAAFYGNFYSATFGTDRVGIQTINFVKENYHWLKHMAYNNHDDDYWYTIKATLKQLEGLYEGYNANCGAKNLQALEAISYEEYDYSDISHGLRFEQFLLINAWGDLYQIAMKYTEPGRNSRLHGNRHLGATTSSSQKKLIQRCSAIIKLLPDFSDVVFGHATWDSYESLGPRIFKHYNLPLMRKGHAEHHYDVYFSSSPAILSSVDDFFVVSGYAQLGVMETTNELYNISLLSLVHPESVLSWTRAVTSNQMASSGADWVKQFSRYASGTYTNQWMSIDLKLFQAGQLPPTGFLTIFEEVPGLVHTADVTNFLTSNLYWPSYNNPYFSDIFEASGYAAVCKFNQKECHDTAPRSYLFKQYQDQVRNIDGGGWILSYNSFQNDTASDNDSCDAIACRGDLEPKKASRGGYGALDAKVSSVLNAKRFPGNAPVIKTRLGPTHDQQPVFCWSQLKDEASYVHHAQPDCFDFDWVTFPPTK